MEFSTGDKVMLRIPISRGDGLSARFNRPYAGPFEIVKKIGSNDYLLKGTSARMKDVVNAARLKRYEERRSAMNQDEEGAEPQNPDGESRPPVREQDTVPDEDEEHPLRRSDRTRRPVKRLCLIAPDARAGDLSRERRERQLSAVTEVKWAVDIDLQAASPLLMVMDRTERAACSGRVQIHAEGVSRAVEFTTAGSGTGHAVIKSLLSLTSARNTQRIMQAVGSRQFGTELLSGKLRAGGIVRGVGYVSPQTFKRTASMALAAIAEETEERDSDPEQEKQSDAQTA